MLIKACRLYLWQEPFDPKRPKLLHVHNIYIRMVDGDEIKLKTYMDIEKY